jgi:hypothetical protein
LAHPAGRRWCRWWIDLVIARYGERLFEEYVPLPHPCPWDPRVELGARVEAELELSGGRGAAWDLVTSVLEAADLATFADLVRSRRVDDDAARSEPQLIPVPELRRGVLGSVFDALARELPGSPERLSEEPAGDDHDDGAIAALAAEAAGPAVESAREHYSAAVKRTLELLA